MLVYDGDFITVVVATVAADDVDVDVVPTVTVTVVDSELVLSC